jgi:hypothetical protein
MGWPLPEARLRVDSTSLSSLFVLMVETIGEAWQLGWRITARCARRKRDGMKSVRLCVYSYQLDMSTLVWTRGAPFPLFDLGARLKCPSCGSRRVALIFHMPKIPIRIT